MNEALPNATVMGYEAHLPQITLPDPDDRHVVAAGIAAGASIILTWNLRDFPPEELQKYGMRGCTPDGFLADLYDALPELTIGTLAKARANLTKSCADAAEFVKVLRAQNLVELANRADKHLGDL